jgi:hypothetical protein
MRPVVDISRERAIELGLPVPRNPKRDEHQIGKTRQVAGEEWQAIVGRSCLWYREHTHLGGGRYEPRVDSVGPAAVIVHCPPPVAGWGRTLRYTGKGPVDFIGWYDLGALIAFDVKTNLGASFELPKPREVMVKTKKGFRKKVLPGQLHQAQFLLDWWVGANAAAFFLVRDGAFGDYAYVVHELTDLETLAAGGRVVLRQRDVALHPVVKILPPDEAARLGKPEVDFLEVIRRVY